MKNFMLLLSHKNGRPAERPLALPGPFTRFNTFYFPRGGLFCFQLYIVQTHLTSEGKMAYLQITSINEDLEPTSFLNNLLFSNAMNI